MTRENMFVNPVREDWMTDELEQKIKEASDSDTISCAKAQAFAKENGIVMNKMKAFVDVAGIKILHCQLGCF